jgi:light-regulated signal transduction histidine kinase (bacteriophytochrome)
MIKGDASQLVQLFQNLLSNAIKFRTERAPEIQISARKEGKYWRFTVRDNGLGFDMKYADRVFIIFQRLHNKETYPGSGIGLAICKKIVERHGGIIRVESEVGKGTSFNFTIPQASGAPKRK